MHNDACLYKTMILLPKTYPLPISQFLQLISLTKNAFEVFSAPSFHKMPFKNLAVLRTLESRVSGAGSVHDVTSQ
jgi:hypothetical protein